MASTKDAISAKGVKVCGEIVDVMDGDAYKKLRRPSGQRTWWAKYLVSNVSGGNAAGDQGWINQFNGNILTAVHGVEAATPHMEKSGDGSIIMISTTAALENS